MEFRELHSPFFPKCTGFCCTSKIMWSGEQTFSPHGEQSSPEGRAQQSSLALYMERSQMVPHLTHEPLVDATFGQMTANM